MIRHCTTIDSDGVPTAISRIISDRKVEDWPEDILAYLAQTSTGPLMPVGNERVFFSSDNDPFLSPESEFPITIEADDQVTNGTVVKLFDVIRASGYAAINLRTTDKK